MRAFLFYILLLCCPGIVRADLLPRLTLTQLPVSDPQPLGNWDKIVLPIKRAGNLILVEAKVDTLVGDFVLDTGAPYLVLNKTYFRTASSTEAIAGIGVSGTTTGNAVRTSIDSLRLGELFYKDIEADITSLSHIEDQRQVKILGLIGTNLFSSMEVRIDLQSNQLILYRLDEAGNTLWKPDSTETDSLKLFHTPELSMKFKLCDDKIFIPVEIAGQKMNWILDTGAETNVVDAWSRKKVMKEFIVNRRINLSGSTGEKQEVLLGVMPEMMIGNEIFTMQQTLVTSMQELSETCSIYIDGILGYSFLSQGIFIINFHKKEFSMYLYNGLHRP